MPSFWSYFNTLLPFATPGTPWLQNLVHLGVICALLYFAPQIQEYLQSKDQNQSLPNQFRAEQSQDEIEADDSDEPEPRDDDFAQIRRHAQHDLVDAENDHNAQEEIGAAPLPDEPPVPGPANGRPQRNVGAKKAKALARRDQRRAYNEFQRSQGEAQRAKDAEGASERERAQAAERERRKAVEAELDGKKAKEREQRRGQERREREQEMQRRQQAIDIVRKDLQERQMSNVFEVAKQVGGDADDVWLEKILKAAGVLGKYSDGSLTIATSLGWIVTIQPEDMLKAYEKVADGARDHDKNNVISYDDLATHLEAVLRRKSG